MNRLSAYVDEEAKNAALQRVHEIDETTHLQIDPILWGTLVFVNLQAAFQSPPVAMSAFYLKGVSPPHVTLNQIFSGMMPYMLIVILCMVIMYLWPGMSLWLPDYLYGK